jgi:hypothetical protein
MRHIKAKIIFWNSMIVAQVKNIVKTREQDVYSLIYLKMRIVYFLCIFTKFLFHHFLPCGSRVIVVYLFQIDYYSKHKICDCVTERFGGSKMNLTGKRVFAVITAAVLAGAVSTMGTFAADGLHTNTLVQESSASYRMTVPASGVGYTTSVTGSSVVAGESFELRVALKTGFQKQEPVVLANGVQLSPLEKDSTAHTYTYVIPEVNADAVFTVSALADTAVPAASEDSGKPQEENPDGFPVHYNGSSPVSNLTGVQPLSCGGLLTFKVYSKTAPQKVSCGNGAVSSVNAAMKAWDEKTQTSEWQVYGIASSSRSSDDTGIYAQVNGTTTRLFSVKLTKAPYTCDTTKNISLKSGKQYWAKVTVAKGTKVSYAAGNGSVVSTLVKNGGKPADLKDGNDTYYMGLKAVKSGETGLYLTVNGQKYCMYRITVA